MAWTLRREGRYNINWSAARSSFARHRRCHRALGRDFAPQAASSPARARPRLTDFFFDEVPDAAAYDGKFNAPMLWNSNFFMTLESMKILHILIDVWLPDFKFGPARCAMIRWREHRGTGRSNMQHWSHRRVGGRNSPSVTW